MAYYKDGIVEFARRLIALDWKILASGGTAKKLAEAGLPVTDIATIVGVPILGHRVVSLSREIHAGLLALNSEEHRAELALHGILRIDLVLIDLYPLEQELARPSATLDSILELEDIGGPTGLSSGAKGKRIVVCEPVDREPVLTMIETGEPFSEDFREFLAAKADYVVSRYRMLTARYRGKGVFEALHGTRVAECLYGENGYQVPAGLYQGHTDDPLAISRFKLVQGTAPSYNNWCDVDRMLQTITHIGAGFEVNASYFLMSPLVGLAVKHGNPCGGAYAGSADSIPLLRQVVEGDTLAIHGGLVMTNFPLDGDCAETLLQYATKGSWRLLDGVLAPSFGEGAIRQLQRKKDKCRLLANSALLHTGVASLDTSRIFRPLRGGDFLVQPNYGYIPNFGDGSIVRYGPERSDLIPDLILAWGIGATSNSNTITLVKDRMLIGNGVGQQDRVGAAELAIVRARRSGHSVEGSVAFSDSFFPFPDGVEALIHAGVKAVFATSGSVNDRATIDACVKKDVSLFMIPDKVGRGFFRH